MPRHVKQAASVWSWITVQVKGQDRTTNYHNVTVVLLLEKDKFKVVVLSTKASLSSCFDRTVLRAKSVEE